MFVCVARVTIDIPAAGSLKGKRQVLRRVTDRVKAKFNVAVAEVEEEILAAPTDVADARAAHAGSEVARHRPAQARLAHHDVADPPPHDAGNQTQAGRLDFGKFRHGEGKAFAEGL